MTRTLMKGNNAELANQTNEVEVTPVFDEQKTYSECVGDIHRQIQELFD